MVSTGLRIYGFHTGGLGWLGISVMLRLGHEYKSDIENESQRRLLLGFAVRYHENV